ncbi:MAG: NAD(P)/FAD-dependent oxidoreductase [Pseudomonadales bacterium]|nr:NAD(P)/FAD-dependent oxidoreductase [Pseudomonadales bacterium]
MMSSNPENSPSSRSVAIIGAGPMGLAAAYELSKKGYSVDIFEAGDVVGGMSASFDFNGLEIERYFHFICATDFDLFELLDELKLSDKLHWVNTRMGYFARGQMCDWGEPFALLRFPFLSLMNKIRYAMKVMYCKNLKSFDHLDKLRATDWLKKWLGETGYDMLWHPLMYQKFYDLQHEVSAAWIAARVQRVAHSRQSLFKEKLGYLEGGSETLLTAMLDEITKKGGSLTLKKPVTEVTIEKNKVKGLLIDGALKPFDHVISTIALPYVSAIVPGLPAQDHEKLNAIKNVGVVCIIMKLSQRFSPYFWLNINHPGIGMPGIIEYSNLNPLDRHILYVPYYMPQNNEKWQWSDEQFRDEIIAGFRVMNSGFDEGWIESFHVSRCYHAQPVCTPEYLSKLPPMKSTVEGFYMADTSYYYPQDRSITESVKVGKQLAKHVFDSDARNV